MKVLEKKYPKGKLKFQKTDGRYIDDYYYENLKTLAKKIVDDMTFMGVCFSSTLEVGTGKSVLMTQTGEIWTELVNELHGTKLTFTEKNIVWRPRELIERAFELPKYSCILLDEWEDAHYWSELAMTLRQFFRKCRQLNLFIIVIAPNFFQFPMPYAIGRSIFAIDVKFEGEFERGFFDFYDFDRKRELYINGRKTHNYKCVKPSFDGRFFDGYGIDRETYLKAKREDLEKWDTDESVSMSPKEMQRMVMIQTLRKLYDAKYLSPKMIMEVFSVSERTARSWMQEGGLNKNKIDFNFPGNHGQSARGDYNKETMTRVKMRVEKEMNPSKELKAVAQ